MQHFDPNGEALPESGIFGLPFTADEATLLLLPIPWEATTTYGKGTARAPNALWQASHQVDLFDVELGNFYEAGIAMLESSLDVDKWHTLAKNAASIFHDFSDISLDEKNKACNIINLQSDQLNNYVYTKTKEVLAKNKMIGVIGGDHSVPFGAIKALLEHYPKMGILQFDAHADLRHAYLGLEFSHASIMFNVISKTALTKLVQVGVRDFCEEEYRLISNSSNRIVTFFDAHLKERQLAGVPWDTLCDEIILHLPHEVYISFDIDGLDPRFCPHTGTPVPGGLDYSEAVYLIKKLVKSGRRLVGFDLNEVSPGMALTASHDSLSEWDANVGARLLYKLCGWTIASGSER